MRSASENELDGWMARVGAMRGLVVAVGVTALAMTSVGRGAAVWLFVPWLVWLAIEWRGGALRAGGKRGVIAGIVTLILPATWLRPCCHQGWR